MAGFVITLVLSVGMMGAIWLLLSPRRKRRDDAYRPVGNLSAAERRRLYTRLGLDPADISGSARSNVIWLEPHRAARRRSTRA